MGNQSQIYVGVIWKYVSEFRMEQKKNVFYIRNFIENVKGFSICTSLSKKHIMKESGFIQKVFNLLIFKSSSSSATTHIIYVDLNEAGANFFQGK